MIHVKTYFVLLQSYCWHCDWMSCHNGSDCDPGL